MKKVLFFAAAAVAMLASCSQNDDLTQPTVAQNDQQEAIQFGTYIGRQAQTRAGSEGAITSAQLLAQKGGFGVFGYYTGTNTYNESQYDNGSATAANYQDTKPNFMFNQFIQGTDVASPSWSYTPIKYWPNEIQNGAVDDNSATSEGTKGGNVSFFAYAPYTGFPITPTTDGIVAINGATALASANNVAGDPTLTYTIPTDINADATGGAFVDLLWGTLNGTSQNAVAASTNLGTEGTNTSSFANPIRPTSGTYASNLLDDYKTNVDLTKQKTEGTVGFKFIHALSKIGGYGNGSTTGFLVQLDIDDNGAETGGSRQSDANIWRTIVTIKDIKITNDLDGSTDINGDEVGIGGTRTLNLATGCWSNDDVTGVYTQTIGTATTTPSFTPNAVLNTKLAEIYDATPTTWLDHLTAAEYFKKTYTEDSSKDHPGVMETPQSVYNSNTQSPILLFPGTTPKFKITIDYIVRTYDANLEDSYSEVEQIVTKTLTFANPVKMNKHYTILMHLGLTGVKFTASVEDWSDFDADESTPGTQPISVDLPINVQ